MDRGRLLRRHVALPGDHGSWVFLISPLLIGLIAGGRFRTTSTYLVVAALAAFLARQPLTVLVKIRSGRRSRDDLAAARFWTALYGAVAFVHVVGLVARGFGYVLYLAIPGVPVFAWFLVLVSRRAERRQLGVELLATAALSLAATAGYWVGAGRPAPEGWLLALLVWLQTAASIVHAYLRLEQRALPRVPELRRRLRMGRTALLLTTANVSVVALLGQAGLVAPWLFVAYGVQWLEAGWGAVSPAVGQRPRTIGLRQLAVSALFTVLFAALWRS